VFLVAQVAAVPTAVVAVLLHRVKAMLVARQVMGMVAQVVAVRAQRVLQVLI
jgi:hypothetical protein